MAWVAGSKRARVARLSGIISEGTIRPPSMTDGKNTSCD